MKNAFVCQWQAGAFFMQGEGRSERPSPVGSGRLKPLRVALARSNPSTLAKLRPTRKSGFLLDSAQLTATQAAEGAHQATLGQIAVVVGE